MFDNPGRKIKTLATVFFWLIIIISVILAFVLGFSKVYDYWGDYNGIRFNAVVFFLLLTGGPLVAYIQALLFVGFGELVENSGTTIPFEPEIIIHKKR